MRTFALMISFAAATLTPLAAAEPTLADFEWMAGRWQGEVYGSVITEMWTPREQGNMTGVFRMMRNRRVGLIEIMTLEERTRGGVVLRMKHLNQLLHSREEKNASLEFQVREVEGRRAVFQVDEGGGVVVTLVYRSPSPDTLVVDFEKTGPKPEKASFPFRRVTLQP
jgi:hypothetical protein